MLTYNKIYSKDLVKMLLTNEVPQDIEIDFNNEKLKFNEVSTLNRYG